MGTIITSIVILFILLTGFFFLLRLFEQRRTKKLLKNYDEKENKSRRTGEGRQTGIRRGESPKVDPTGSNKPEGERLLPTTASSESGEDRESVGRPERFRGILRKLRRRKS